jgi:hypothetical protein
MDASGMGVLAIISVPFKMLSFGVSKSRATWLAIAQYDASCAGWDGKY